MSRHAKDDPSGNQTPEEISTYYQNAKIGDPAVIRQTQLGVLRFQLTEIENIKSERGRLYLKQGASDWGGSAFYRKGGKCCFAPTGQTSLVVPTTAVRAWIKANPDPWKL
ncbi:MAG: hypothetical protein QOH67_1979 [Hyphomicrobiales bacterium]|nr:hypothetical protein [Hyphomicrobiales bacterium]